MSTTPSDTGDIDWDLISSYGGLLSLAVISIYSGSLGSLAPDDPNDKDEEEDIPDRMSSEDAYLFPVIGSAVLGGLFLFIKYFGAEWINWFLGWYFTFTGVGSVWKGLTTFTRTFIVGKSRWATFDQMSLSIKKAKTDLIKLSWRTPTMWLLPLSALPSILYTFSVGEKKSVLLTDILALSFSFNALSLLKLDSFKTGTILLTGLFFYDIWWVFGTKVMVSVATTLDVPIKLLWPKSLIFADTRGYTMLGLGDVVIPGTFIALALRYDHRHRNQGTSGSVPKPSSTPYFHTALVSYVLGLGTTMGVMHFFKAAQPALLYLSPACILSFLLTAMVRGEFQEAWTWTDEPMSSKAPVEAGKDALQEKAIEQETSAHVASES